jgi:sugar O-acyltransferase (sialic acid O-acetyltransferase NeuD family)
MRDLVIFGTGGFAREVLQIVEDINRDSKTWNLVGFLDEDKGRWGTRCHALPVLGGSEWLGKHPDTVVTIAIGSSAIRRRIVLELLHMEHTEFATLVHPLAWISKGVNIGAGTIIHAGVLISPDVKIGKHTFVNKNCTIGHNTVVGDYSTVAPSATVGGEVHLGEGCEVGANGTIIQQLSIGDWTIIGAGAVVVKDMPSNITAVGIPAIPIKERPQGWYEEV